MMTDEIPGYMPMPDGFRYADVFRRGRPRHGTAGIYVTYDMFYLKHPPMKTANRAKIFASFDALSGFSEAVTAKEVPYEAKRELAEDEIEELGRRMEILQQLTAYNNSGMILEGKKVRITITHFVPCHDPENEAFGKLGTYESLTGDLLKVDVHNRRILLDTGAVPFHTILKIEGVELFREDKADR